MNRDIPENSFPLAMDPPQEKVTIITTELINNAVDMSRKSPRGRIILPFHKQSTDLLHRMLNVVQPFSYIQPHRHSDPPKAESIIVIQGFIAYITFNDAGEILETLKLSNQSHKIGVDTEPGVFHTFLTLEKDTVLFEIKPGPYEKNSDKDFAKWAPSEHSESAKAYIKYLYGLIDESKNE